MWSEDGSWHNRFEGLFLLFDDCHLLVFTFQTGSVEIHGSQAVEIQELKRKPVFSSTRVSRALYFFRAPRRTFQIWSRLGVVVPSMSPVCVQGF